MLSMGGLWLRLIGLLTVTSGGAQCFSLAGFVLFQALVGYLLAKGQSLAGCIQEESFWGGLSPDSTCKNRVSCSPKVLDTSQHVGSLVSALILSWAPDVLKGGEL